MFWSGKAFFLNEQPPSHDITTGFFDIFVTHPNTLVRTLIWVHVQSYGQYDQGDGGQMIVPRSWAFSELNSVHNTLTEVSDVPGNAGQELLATSMVDMQWTGLGWPPNSTGTLSGSINSIDSSGSLAIDYNSNQFMYGSGMSFVDSKAERHFTDTPLYHFTFHDWASSIGGGDRGASKVWGMVRLLYEHE